MPRGRKYEQAGMVTYPDKSYGILVTGGEDNKTMSDFLDLETLTWQPKAPLPFEINRGTSVPYHESFLILGGRDDRGIEHDEILYYDPIDDEWIVLEQKLAKPKMYFSAFTVPDSYIQCA